VIYIKKRGKMTQKQEIQRLKEELESLRKLYEKAINQLVKYERGKMKWQK
jgi:hypothetical protein